MQPRASLVFLPNFQQMQKQFLYEKWSIRLEAAGKEVKETVTETSRYI